MTRKALVIMILAQFFATTLWSAPKNDVPKYEKSDSTEPDFYVDFYLKNLYRQEPEGLLIAEFTTDYRNFNQVLPIYKFDDDLEGQFISDFCDSLLKIGSWSSCIFIQKSDSASNSYLRQMPQDAIYLNVREIMENILSQSKGLILLDNNRFGLIGSNDKIFLENLHLTETSDSILLKTVKPQDNNKYIIFLYDTDIWAVLKKPSEGKVEPLMIYKSSNPIQQGLNPEFTRPFDWVEEFYLKHNLPAGAAFESQTKLDPDYEDYVRKMKNKLQPPLELAYPITTK